LFINSRMRRCPSGTSSRSMILLYIPCRRTLADMVNPPSSCGHYWLLCGVSTAVALYRPAYSASALKGTIFDNSNWIGAWVAAWAVSVLFTQALTRTLRLLTTFAMAFPVGGIFKPFDPSQLAQHPNSSRSSTKVPPRVWVRPCHLRQLPV
jgi:hypothetical protein